MHSSTVVAWPMIKRVKQRLVMNQSNKTRGVTEAIAGSG
jgi:hypothetical protein